MKNTFPKAERLSSKKVIGRLFKRGSAEVASYYLFPFRVMAITEPALVSPSDKAPEPSPDPVAPTLPAILISVSKKSFKRAVDRNLVRRRIREAYRLNKGVIFSESSRPLPNYVAFLYTAKTILSFEEIEKGTKLALKKMTKSL